MPVNQIQPVDLSVHRNAALCLSLVPGVGPRIYNELMAHYGSPQQVLDQPPTALREVPGVGHQLAAAIAAARTSIDVHSILETCRENEISIVDRADDGYPQPLKEIFDPPSLLFTQGNFAAEDSISLAIVGSRHATRYGIKTAEQLARGLSMAGFTIVSGLARGIDAAAHRGALQSGGRTLAVLGSGLLNLYPAEHKELADEIRYQGAVISESLPFQPPKSGAFPKRNRIVTGLCLGVIIVEAAQRSGALISARLAGEQNREVFAVPGRIDSRMSRGCHALIRDGATLVESVDDVLEQLGPLATPAKLDENKTIRHPAELKLTEQESRVLQAVDLQPTVIDDIVTRTELPVARVLSTISVLEIRRLVRRVSGTQVVRV